MKNKKALLVPFLLLALTPNPNFIDKGICFPGVIVQSLSTNKSTLYSCTLDGRLWIEGRFNGGLKTIFFKHEQDAKYILDLKDTI